MTEQNVEKPRVLIVDDEERFRKTLAKLLTAKEMEVRTAAGGEEAIAVIREHPVDVVLLDMRMPGMNGIDTLSALKALDPLVEIIMLTGHASVDVAVEIMRRGGYEYLLKPYDLDDLLVKIEAAWERRKLKEARTQGGATPP